MTLVTYLYGNEPISDHSRPLDTRKPMNKISILLLVMVAFAVALVVGLLVVAPDGAVENPPGGMVLPFGVGY